MRTVLAVILLVASIQLVLSSSGSVAIYSPTYSTSYYTGQTYTISYSTSTFAPSSTSCTISYQNINDYYWTTITSFGSVSGIGQYMWYIPSGTPSGSYRIRITDNYSGSAAQGTSDYFSINNSANALAAGWIVLIVLSIVFCIACVACQQWRRRQRAIDSAAYMNLAPNTTTVLVANQPQPPMIQQTASNPALLYAPPQPQQMGQTTVVLPPTSYNPYVVVQQPLMAPPQQIQPSAPPAYYEPQQQPPQYQALNMQPTL